jgi:hypothetical protein
MNFLIQTPHFSKLIEIYNKKSKHLKINLVRKGRIDNSPKKDQLDNILRSDLSQDILHLLLKIKYRLNLNSLFKS